MAVIFRGDVLRMTVAYTHVPTLILQHRRTPPPPSKSSTTTQHRHPTLTMPPPTEYEPNVGRTQHYHGPTKSCHPLPTIHASNLNLLRLCERKPLSSLTLQLLSPSSATMVASIAMAIRSSCLQNYSFNKKNGDIQSKLDQ
ncbi:hypothetical protein JHK82_039737 [Glycine max]|nr:hypothetical protein JHK82_039737 [Glycine max]